MNVSVVFAWLRYDTVFTNNINVTIWIYYENVAIFNLTIKLIIGIWHLFLPDNQDTLLEFG